MPTENELAARLGASRTMVREAVKILSAIGRVRVQKGRGLFVADDEGMLGSSRRGALFLPTDLDHVYLLFEFRRVQEAFAGRLDIAAASHDAFLVASVREARRLQCQSSTIGTHGAIGGHATEAIAEHDAIYQAIRDGDPQAAAEAAGLHLDSTLQDHRREIQRRVFG